MFSIPRFTLVAALTVSASLSLAAEICIDPGHGGSDPGAVGIGGYEKNNNLDSCLRQRNWLNADTNDGAGGGSWAVVMTRTTDVYVGLSARAAIANNNASHRFMSTHNNAFNDNANGTETFSHTENNATSNDLRNKVQQRTLEAWGLLNRGNKQYNFAVLRETNMPADLAELGFIDANPDAGYVSNATHREKCARYHLYAIQNHMGIATYTPGSTPTLPTYTLDNNQAGFSVVGSWATGTSSADKYGTDYRFKSTAAVSEPASWAISVGVAGTYRVQAWWPAGSNRSTGAPYILPDNSNPKVNQQINGGKWNTLGTVALGTGTRTTKLSCWAASGYIVVADAVRYTP